MLAAIGIDIGGSAIKLGRVAADGRVLTRRRLPFDRDAPFPDLVAGIAAAARDLAPGAQAIGIATPGYADPADGRLLDGTDNVPALAGQSLTRALSATLGLPAVIENDGTAATFAEMRCGAGRGLRRFALIAIGTGIGGGIAIDGRIVTGNAGEPPELGAMVLDPDGERNYSGLAGTFEHLAAADGFLAAHRGRTSAPAVDVGALFAADDAAARDAIDATARRIAQAAGTMINLLNLEACLLGGGVADAAGPPLAAAVARHLPDFTWPFLLRRARLLPAGLGNDAGMIGAALLALDRA